MGEIRTSLGRGADRHRDQPDLLVAFTTFTGEFADHEKVIDDNPSVVVERYVEEQKIVSQKKRMRKLRKTMFQKLQKT
jgi:hypothetical protein